MKNDLGRSLLLLLLLAMTLYAKESKYCSYEISSNKSEVMLYEAVAIHFQARQKIHNEVMFFDLKPQKKSDYEVVLLNEKRYEFNYHDAKKSFDFLIIPKRSGTLTISFDFQIRRASDDAVAQAYTGSRDNVKSIPTIKVPIDTPSIALHVNNPTQPIEATGDFSLKMKIDKESSNAYDAINVVYTLNGTGYLDEHFEPLKNLDGPSIFKGEKASPKLATKNGWRYHKEWSYAIVSDKGFTIPMVRLQYYNFNQKEYLSATTPSKSISITPIDTATLLDDDEYPKGEIDFRAYLHYLYYLIMFIAGFLAAKALEYLPQKFKRSDKEVCCKAIRKSSNAQELLKAVMPYVERYNIDKEMQEIERLLGSKGSKASLEALKRALLKKIG